MTRGDRAKIAAETVQIVERGSYRSPSGATIDLTEQIRAAVSGTELVLPEDWPAVMERADAIAASRPASHRPEVEVTGETTLAAALRLTDAGHDVLALNFASAKNPGGGFLGGSQAQEESLARASALVATLHAAPAYYEINRRASSALYTDCLIHSPRVPVFRDDDGRLRDAPYPVSFVTAPAVNVSALRQGRGVRPPDVVTQTMRRRILHVLGVAVVRGHRSLVLGAWGCGVFGNDPEVIAALFAEALTLPLARCFDRVTFAVLDNTTWRPTFNAFASRLNPEGREEGKRTRGR